MDSKEIKEDAFNQAREIIGNDIEYIYNKDHCTRIDHITIAILSAAGFMMNHYKDSILDNVSCVADSAAKCADDNWEINES